MANPGAKEQFLKQFENIVEGIKQNKAKVSNSVFVAIMSPLADHTTSYSFFKITFTVKLPS